MNFIWGFIGGILAWFATEFIGQLIKTFFAARAEAARVLAQFQDLDYYDPGEEWPEVTADQAEERKKALSAAGATLIAFARSNQYVVRPFRRLGFRPENAGNALMLLSQLPPRGSNNEDQREAAERYLKLGYRFGPRLYRRARSSRG